MFGHLSYKTKQFFFLLIKLSIVCGAFYFIYNKLTTNEALDFKVFIAYVSKNKIFSFENIIILFSLTSLNWFFEILKWKNLASTVSKISLLDAFKQSVASLTVSLFTPNRIGEYGAKALFYTSRFRKRILLLNLMSNLSQLFTTLVFGCVGFILFYLQYDVDISLKTLFRIVTIYIVIGFSFVLGYKVTKFKYNGISVESLKVFLISIPSYIHLKTLLLSVIRYLIFSFQFFVLLRFFGIDVYYYNAMLVITSFYLLSSLVPTIFIFDVIVKGSIALYLFSFVSVNDLTILSITTLMWLLNFVSVSCIGSVFVIQYKLPVKKNKN